jgi:hypothetical protein
MQMPEIKIKFPQPAPASQIHQTRIDAPRLFPFPFRRVHFILQRLNVVAQSLATRLKSLDISKATY